MGTSRLTPACSQGPGLDCARSMVPANRGGGGENTPTVEPIGAIESLLARFSAWVRRVGEAKVVWAALAISFALAAVLILSFSKGQSFVNDEWHYLVVARGWSLETLLTPQNGHLILVPLLLYKMLFATVGTDSHLPYQVVTVVLHLTVATLFFLLVRKLLPAAVALSLTFLVVFFGAGWDTIMGAYEIPNLTGMASGLGMLLAIERRTRLGDLTAGILLAVSLASFSVGLAFAVGGMVSIWLGGREQWRRAWVVLAPPLLYVAWFVWARKFGQSDVTAEAVGGVLSGIADQLAANCAAITGLFRAPGSADLPTLIGIRPEWGYPLALILAGLVALHVDRARQSIRFWTVAATLLAFLTLIAIGLDPARAPNASRYVYMGGILTLLLVAELARDIRWSTPIGLVAFVLLGLSLLANVAELRAGGRLFEAEGATNRATLAALELSRDRVDPSLAVEDASTAHSHPDMLFPAYAYFDAADDFGSLAFTPEQVLGAGDQAREAADQELVRALALTARPVANPAVDRLGQPPKLLASSNGRAQPAGSCLVLVPDVGRTGAFQVEVARGGFGYLTAPGTEVGLKLARFGEAFSTSLPTASGSAEVAIPTDASDLPWRAELTTGARALTCPL